MSTDLTGQVLLPRIRPAQHQPRPCAGSGFADAKAGVSTWLPAAPAANGLPGRHSRRVLGTSAPETTRRYVLTDVSDLRSVVDAAA